MARPLRIEFEDAIYHVMARGNAGRHRRPGHLFRGRFRGELIEDENYCWNVSRYIHLNPVRGKRPLAARPAQ